MWYEDENLIGLGMIEFGFNSITEIEVYWDKSEKVLKFCDHDSPDEDIGIEGVLESVRDCNDPKYDEQVEFAEQMLRMKLR